MSPLAIRYEGGGVHLPKLGLWLDPHEPKAGAERVFVSHAHSDHIGLHREVILSPPTAKLMRARLSGVWQEHVLDFDQAAEFDSPSGPFQITLLPAGHIFGSAMALLEVGGSSLLYTGDFKLRPGLSAEKCEARQADVLVMETTYGLPRYQFPPTADVLRGVVRFCREALDNEETPVLLGYSLGKSQELLCGLAEANLPIMLHGTVQRLTKIYEQFGHCFPPYEKLESKEARGRILICPPNTLNSPILRQLGPTRLAVLTGWAVDPNCRYRYQAHAAFPLSDHADFSDLIEMVKRVGPKQVYTLHGFASDFAQTLRDLGYTAEALSEDDQLSLPLDLSSSVLRDGPAAKPSPAAAPIKVSIPPGSVLAAAVLAQAPPGQGSFEGFASTCLRISGTAKKLEKTAALADYLRNADEADLGLVSSWFTGHPFPPCENKVLRLGWAIVRDALCHVAQMDQAAFGQIYLKHSDLGETTHELLLRTAPAAATLPIQAVQELFQAIHSARGPSGKLPLLARALSRCTALEGKYLIKILTGDLRIGLKEGLVEEAIAQAFEVALDQVKNTNLLLGSIAETATLARRGELTSARLVPFRPLKFMLASPEPDAAGIWQRVSNWPGEPNPSTLPEAPLPLGPIESPPSVWLEDKYDGIRSQMHKVGDRVALYSRDLREITTAFLDIADAAREAAADFILDGEIVAMRGQQILPFSELQKRLGRREGDLFLGQQIPVRFTAFDLLWLNGESLLDQPLRVRRSRLEEVSSKAVQLAQITRAHGEASIEQAFTDARARGNEGLMIKDPSSAYSPGRRGLAWLKLKKACATLDCVVVGAEYGHGKRKAVLSDYTFAVRDDKTGKLRTIGKAYSGLTDAEIAQLTEHFFKRAIAQHGRYFELEPDTVLEIAFDAVQESTRHDSGLALRFPRILRVRADKTPAEIDTLETARQLVKTTATKPAGPNSLPNRRKGIE